MTSVYVTMCGDILHSGHINMLHRAAELGRVTVGLLSDEAVAAYKRVTFMPFSERLSVIEALGVVGNVVPQVENTPRENLLRLRPDIFVHGDDWARGKETWVRDRVISVLASYGGRLVEFPYTEGVSSTQMQARAREVRRIFASPGADLRRLLAEKLVTRAVAAKSLNEMAETSGFAVERKAVDVQWLSFGGAADLRNGDIFGLTQRLLDGPPAVIEFPDKTASRALADACRVAARIGVAGVCMPATALADLAAMPDAASLRYILQELVVIASLATNEVAPHGTEVADMLLHSGGTGTPDLSGQPLRAALGLRGAIGSLPPEDALARKGIRFVLYEPPGGGMAQARNLFERAMVDVTHSKT